MDNISHVTTIHGEQQLKRVLTESLRDYKLVLLDFTARWCKPCQNIKPALQSLALRKQSQLVVVEIDVDHSDNSGLVQHFAVQSMPTFIFIVNNTVVNIITGAQEEALLKTADLLVNTMIACRK